MRVLHAAAELFPWVKVGGLGDVLSALPQALERLGADPALLMPGYPALVAASESRESFDEFPKLLGGGPHRLVRCALPGHPRVYLLEGPFFDRPGNPYQEQGDSHRRFGALGWVAAWLARRGDDRGWAPQVLHLHDWQTGLAPAYLSLEPGPRPATLMTIHNLAYQGRYGKAALKEVGLPESLWHPHAVEYHGDLSFLKAGLQMADRLSTVSPTYAREIQTPALGEGLDPLLAHRSGQLSGILNGVDPRVWDPAHDPHIPAHFDLKHPRGKARCKAELQREFGLAVEEETPLFGVVSRLAGQKGLDLVLENVEHLVDLGAQLALLGTGDPVLEEGFQVAAARHAGRIGVRLAFEEALSHRVVAGADSLLVPSRFEPCGLTQLYALRYGTLPLVRRTGGLADTVVDAEPWSLEHGTATGFTFDPASGWVLGETLGRAVALYREQPEAWTRMRRTAMSRDFGWEASARSYLELYRSMV